MPLLACVLRAACKTARVRTRVKVCGAQVRSLARAKASAADAVGDHAVCHNATLRRARAKVPAADAVGDHAVCHNATLRRAHAPVSAGLGVV